MANEFEPIAKRLWHGDGNAALLVEALDDRGRAGVQRALVSLFGIAVDLSGSVADIDAAVLKAKKA
jgi:hypothetical protein